MVGPVIKRVSGDEPLSQEPKKRIKNRHAINKNEAFIKSLVVGLIK
jgi:hypothetical protein